MQTATLINNSGVKTRAMRRQDQEILWSDVEEKDYSLNPLAEPFIADSCSMADSIESHDMPPLTPELRRQNDGIIPEATVPLESSPSPPSLQDMDSESTAFSESEDTFEPDIFIRYKMCRCCAKRCAGDALICAKCSCRAGVCTDCVSKGQHKIHFAN